MNKPIVSYHRGNDPTRDFDKWKDKLTEINIIRTKVLTDDFIDFCVLNHKRIFLHIVINGMGHSVLEKNIPTVKWSFAMIGKLISKGFPQKQILVVVDPIIPNENGLKSLQLLLKVFTEFKQLRLRHLKFKVLSYRNVGSFVGKNEPINEHIISTHKDSYNKSNDKFVIANKNIVIRPEIKQMKKFLFRSDFFFPEYYKLLNKYKSIINIDSGNESLIGIRELMALGYNNSWKTSEGKIEKIIYYKDDDRNKPIVNHLDSATKFRCLNRCLLCSFKQ